MVQVSWATALSRLVGQNVQRLRRSRTPKLTQDGLSRRTDSALSRSSIASIERGLQGLSLAQLYVLAQALEVEPSELLPSRAELFAPRTPSLDEVVRASSPKVASFLREVQKGPATKKGDADA